MLCVFCGIVGSGKSTLARRIAEATDNTVVIEFDQYSCGDFSAEAWKSDRASAISAVRSGLYSSQTVIVDDNMRLPSMRKEMLYLAQEFGVGFLIVWVHCDPSVARERNLLRVAPVPEHIRERLENGFDPPDSVKRPWESGWVLGASIDDVLSRIEDERSHPRTKHVVVKGPSGNSRAHEIDILTRRVIGDILKRPFTDKASVARMLKNSKIDFMKQLSDATSPCDAEIQFQLVCEKSLQRHSSS